MNEQIAKIAHKVQPEDDALQYAVVVKEGNSRYGLYDISTEDSYRESLAKLATNEDVIPGEIREVAFGVINTVFMTKTGSAIPLIADVMPLDTNEIDVSEINWAHYDELSKTASRAGYMFNDTFLPLDTTANVQAAAELLAQNEQRFPGQERVKFASAIREQAVALGTYVPPLVEKYAHGTVNPEIYELLDDRMKLAKDYPETVSAIEKVKDEANIVPASKTAEDLNMIDQMLPFSVSFAKHGSVLGSDRPVFYSTVKVPDAYETTYGSSARPLSLAEKVAAIDDDKLTPVFSEAFIQRLRENPNTVIKTAAPQVVATLKTLTM